MKRWKGWRKRRPRLSRGWKTARNLLLCVLILVWFWALADYPLPARMNFRRMERENLMSRSEIQGVFRDSGQGWVVYGTRGDQVVLGHGRSLSHWPRAEAGAALFPVSGGNPSPKELLFAAADVPEGTASARLDMAADCWLARNSWGGTSFSALEGGYPRDDSLYWSQWERSYQAEGKLLKDGGVLFRVPRKEAGNDLSAEWSVFYTLSRDNAYRYQSDEARGANCRVEAVFYDQAGAELGRAVLSTTEGGEGPC